jgi:hypothetical protein
MLGIFGYYLWRQKRGYRRPKGPGLRGFLRVVGYGVGVSAVLGATAFHSAKADLGQATLSFGRELLPLADALGDTNKIRMNGEAIYLGTAVLQDQSVKVVLDRFEQHCKDNQGPWAELWSQAAKLNDAMAKLPDPKGKISEGLPINKDGVFRQGDDGQGAVMCFTKWAGTLSDYEEAYRQFAKSGDFGRLGKLRYVFAARTAQGNTRVVSVFSDGSLNINNIIPPDSGDAPGEEATLAPRPPDSRRILSAGVEGTPYGVRVYKTQMPPSAVLDYYDDTMQKAGWQPVIPVDPAENAKFRGYAKGALELVVTADKREGGTSVSLGEMGAGNN